jgi:hypothetical protein
MGLEPWSFDHRLAGRLKISLAVELIAFPGFQIIDFRSARHMTALIRPFPIRSLLALRWRSLMSNLDFKTVVKQEEERLRRLHPTPNDIPGCLSLFDDYLSCTGMLMNFRPARYTNLAT